MGTFNAVSQPAQIHGGPKEARNDAKTSYTKNKVSTFSYLHSRVHSCYLALSSSVVHHRRPMPSSPDPHRRESSCQTESSDGRRPCAQLHTCSCGFLHMPPNGKDRTFDQTATGRPACRQCSTSVVDGMDTSTGNNINFWGRRREGKKTNNKHNMLLRHGHLQWLQFCIRTGTRVGSADLCHVLVRSLS